MIRRTKLPDQVATRRDFDQVTRELERRRRLDLRPLPEPPAEEPILVMSHSPPVDDSIYLAETQSVDAVSGLPMVEPEDLEVRYIERGAPQLDPGVSLDPDQNIISDDPDTFVTIQGARFRLVRGPKEDSELVERQLGDSYGG
jgi:hypothetical protein